MSLKEKFDLFTSKNYPDQGKCFLNAYWSEHQGEAENVWQWCQKFIELDEAKGKEGKDLDEFQAHRFLESIEESKTVKEMRQQLTEADLDFNKRLALIEYCLWRYNHKVSDFVERPQAADEEIAKYTLKLKQVQAALDDATKKATAAEESAKAAAQREKEAQKRAEEAKEKEAESEKQEAECKKAEEEMKAALAEVKAQEDAYNAKTETLKKKSEEGGLVSRNRAKAELAQHLAEDPLPLSRAKISQEAATKRAQKAKEQASAALEAAKQARQQAEEASQAAQEARKDAENARDEANAAVDEVTKQVEEAEAALMKAKASSTAGQGNIYWVQRELDEAKKYLPRKKGGTW